MLRPCTTAEMKSGGLHNRGTPGRSPLLLPSRSRRRSSHSLSSRGFTLLELMLTLGVLVSITAIIWPVFTRTFSNHRLQKAGDVLRTSWANTRLQAMSTGVTHVVQFDYGTSQFIIKADDVEGAEADASDGVGIPQREGSLPEGVRFHAGEKVLDSRVSASSGESATTPQIYFFPDGSSSTAQLLLTNDDERFVKVELRGLTGISTVGPVMAGSEVGQ